MNIFFAGFDFFIETVSFSIDLDQFNKTKYVWLKIFSPIRIN
jgi:hypothetical protein